MRAWTSPANRSKRTFLSAWTPGKDLWMPSMTRSGDCGENGIVVVQTFSLHVQVENLHYKLLPDGIQLVDVERAELGDAADGDGFEEFVVVGREETSGNGNAAVVGEDFQ